MKHACVETCRSLSEVMPVWLRNLQSRVWFNAPLLKLQCGLLLDLLRVGRYDVSVVCMDSEGIRNLNNVYRNVDAARVTSVVTAENLG